MGLWLKKDGEFISVSGSSAGNGEVLTGDPDNPPEEWAVGQLLYDGVEDTGDGSAGGSIQYHSIGTSGVAGIEATEVDLPIVDVYGGPLVVGQKYAVSSEGSFRFGVGATSFVKQTVNINGSPAVECLAYKTFIDNERFMVSASRSWNCDDANPAVTVVASCSAGSMQTFNTGERRANVTFTPMQSSGGGGGDAGPHNHDEYALVEHDHDEFTHDHDYLPLSGGTVTGDLKIDGQIDGTTTINGSIHAGYGLYLSGGGGGRSMISNNTGDRELLQIRGHLPEGASAADALDYAAGINVYGNGDPTYPGMVRMYSDGQTRFQIDKDGKTEINGWLTIKQPNANTLCLDRTGDENVEYPVYLGASYNTLNGEKVTAFRVTINGKVLLNIRENETTILEGDLEVKGKISSQSVFGIADGINTADVLERAETATMPAPDEGVATTDVDVLTVNDVVTALLLKVKELSAEIEELKGA